MAFILSDRVRETTTSPGTGTVTLNGALTGYQAFSAGIGANNTTYYVIADQQGSNWEVGVGTLGAGGTTLVRTTVLSSSNSNSLVNFTSGTQDVFCDYPSGKAVYKNDLNDVTLGSSWDKGTGVLQVTGNSAFDGTVVDKQVVVAGGNNLLTYSQDFSNAAWTKSNLSVTANSTSAPDGTNTGTLVTTAGTSHSVYEYVTVIPNTIYTFSFYALRGTLTDLKYSIYNNTALANIIAPTSYYSQTSSSAWTKISVVFTVPAGCSQVIVYPLRDSGVTGTCYIWGAQLEQGNTATPYTPTTTTAVSTINDVYIPTGAVRNGTWNQGTGSLQITGNTSVNGTAVEKNLVLAGGNNLYTYSEQFDNAAWTKTATATVAADQTTAPNGTLTADSLDRASAGTMYVRQSATCTASTRYTFSVYVKAKNATAFTATEATLGSSSAVTLTGAGTVTITDTGGSPTGTITFIGNGWYRATFSYTTGSAQTTTFINQFSESCYLWGAQLETGTVASAYTATTSAAVSATNQVLAADGTAALPSVSFNSQTSMGLFKAATNKLGLSTTGDVNYNFLFDNYKFTMSSSGQLGFTSGGASAGVDTILTRDAANTLAQRNSTNAQTYNLYNTYTDASNYERLSVGWSANTLTIQNQKAGTGLDRNLTLSSSANTAVNGNQILFQIAGTNKVIIDGSGNITPSGRINPRVTTTTSSGTPSINSDTTDIYGLTAQAADITSVTVTGTPVDGQKLWVYIVGTAARAITWGTSFEASTTALPTTTVTTNRLDVGFVWNAATSKWRCLAVA
jgi:hypothetical protein